LSECSSLRKAPLFEQTRLIELARTGVLKHRSKCPLAECKGLLKKAVAFVTKENHVRELFPADVLTCDRKKCDFNIILNYQEVP